MSTGYVTERSPVAKHKTPSDRTGRKPPKEPTSDRVEFQAPIEWVQQLDAAAAALGMGRSAYIRMSCNRQMEADRKARE